ncbi:hypothetical protein J6590_032652 [Homalodisca vitripennis]|nr:hypothetical protein J6590_032652 [Homalodisca vitripennis]
MAFLLLCVDGLLEAVDKETRPSQIGVKGHWFPVEDLWTVQPSANSQANSHSPRLPRSVTIWYQKWSQGVTVNVSCISTQPTSP